MTSLKIVSTNPLDHAGEIKELFLADGQPQFADFFDRAYVSAVRDGGMSWIGLDGDGRLAIHIARFRRRFILGERPVVGGVLLDLRAAKAHRTVVPALALMRQLVTDSKRERDVDFLYATPGAAGTAVLKAAGFSPVTTLARFVFPLGDGRWYMDAAARAYQLMLRIRAWNDGVEVVEHPPHLFDVSAFERPADASPGLRAVRSPDLFRQCLAGYPGRTDHWLTFHRGSRTARPSGAGLVRGGADGVATLFSITRKSSLPLSAIIPPVAAVMRHAGYRRLSVSTLTGTRFATEFTRAGFVQRADHLPMMACSVTELGADALRSIKGWEITAIDGDPYIP